MGLMLSIVKVALRLPRLVLEPVTICMQVSMWNEMSRSTQPGHPSMGRSLVKWLQFDSKQPRVISYICHMFELLYCLNDW